MNSWIDVAGWTLVHFLWQGAAIAAMAGVLLWLLRQRSPQTRYVLACISLVAMIAAPLVSVAVLSRSIAVTGSRAELPVPLEAGSGDVSVLDALAILTNLTMARSVSSVDAVPVGIRMWLPLVVLLWIAGVGVLLLRLLGGWWRVHRLQRVSRVAKPSAWSGAAARIATSLGVAR